MKITAYPQNFIETPVFADEYQLGGHTEFKGTILREDGDWRPYTPPIEDQLKYGIETSACASFGTLNAVEMLAQHKFNLELNLSDRFLAKMSGTLPTGNSPHKVGETLRKRWSVHEVQWPFNEKEYYRDIPNELIDTAKRAGKHWNFQHEWIITNLTRAEDKREIMEDCLKFSPIGVSVFAWAEDNDVYVKAGTDNHWCVCFYADKDYYYILDTYAPYVKRLERNYQFGYAKRYSLDRREPSWLDKFLEKFYGNTSL